MDYSRKEVNKKIRQLKTKSDRAYTKLSINGFRIFLLVLLGLGITGGFALFGTLSGILKASPSIESVSVAPEGYVTRFFYTDGTVSQTLIGAGGNREYVALDNLPSYVYNSFVAIEDERFWKHDGIDVRSIFRSISEVITSLSLETGGSTITQQLLKNQVFQGGNEKNSFRKLVRKFQEQYLAIQLENTLSKEQILEYYINSINLGQGTYGVEMAATTYFGKSAQDLTISEAAVLACIAQSPTNQNPYTHPEKNIVRREDVLDEMLDNEFITQEEYDEAMADTEDVYKRINDYVEANSGRTYYTYFTDEVIAQLMSDLTAAGYSPVQASNLIYTGGLEVYTTQDREIQAIVDEVINDQELWPSLGKGSYYSIDYALSLQKKDGTVIHYQLYHFLDYFNYFIGSSSTSVRIYGGVYNLMSTNKFYVEDCVEQFRNAKIEEGDIVLGERFTETLEPQTSFVMLDHTTGAIVALSGGRGEKIGNRVMNRATDSLRSVGSTFKVLAAYLPAFDTGTLTLASALDDSPYFYPGTTKKVNNWYGANTYKGINTTRLGISYSMNILACRSIEAVTPQVAFEYLKKLGFTSLVEYEIGKDGYGYTDIGVPVALGGLTNGVTNLELTAAYAAIANNGVYNKPFYYTEVLSHDGKVLLSHKSSSTQVMKTSTAFLLTSAMQDTLKKTIGTAAIAAFKEYPMSLAGKSGTTQENYDLWFEGFSPYYTAGIWEGFDISYYITTTNTHEILWREIMERTHKAKGLEDIGFKKPSSVVTATICTKCGKLGIKGLCDNYIAGDCLVTEYFAIGTVPTEYCDCHNKVKICNKSGLIATESCDDYREVVYLLKEEGRVWTPVDDDLTILSPTPSPIGYVPPTATPLPGSTKAPTPTPTLSPTPTPVGWERTPEDYDSPMEWFADLLATLKERLTDSFENELFFAENEATLDQLALLLTPTPAEPPVYIAEKTEVIYTTSDTKNIMPSVRCYECAVKIGLVTPTPTAIPTSTPTPSPSPTPTMSPEELDQFLHSMQVLLHPSATPTPTMPGEWNTDDPYWTPGEGEGEDWSNWGQNDEYDYFTPTPTPTPFMTPTPVPTPEPEQTDIPEVTEPEDNPDIQVPGENPEIPEPEEPEDNPELPEPEEPNDTGDNPEASEPEEPDGTGDTSEENEPEEPNDTGDNPEASEPEDSADNPETSEPEDTDETPDIPNEDVPYTPDPNAVG